MSRSSIDLLVLHGLRLKGFADATVLADLVGRPMATIERRLQSMADQGYARPRAGARPGWTLTPEGRKENERLVADELDVSGRRPALRSLYRDFLALNQPFLELCTRWQVRDRAANTLNDHRDEAYDHAVVAQLIEIDARVQPMCAELGSWFDRFGAYGSRFSAALDKLLAGDLEWFVKPTIDSYHTVWFELHEDLLVTLGIDRASERVEKRDE